MPLGQEEVFLGREGVHVNLTIAVHVRNDTSVTLTPIRVNHPIANFAVAQCDVLIDELLRSKGIDLIGNQGLKRVMSVAARVERPDERPDINVEIMCTGFLSNHEVAGGGAGS